MGRGGAGGALAVSALARAGAAAVEGRTSPSYFVALGFGALAGAWLLGSANSLRGPIAAPSHSIAGALAGGIVAVELWKLAPRRPAVDRRRAGRCRSASGIVIGRLGCFFAGLPDYTYGSTDQPALGGGPRRRRSAATRSSSTNRWRWPGSSRSICARASATPLGARHAFHAMIIFYAGQRFVWEFLKPYPAVLGPLNVFHLLMLGLVAYGLFWWGRDNRAEHRAAA